MVTVREYLEKNPSKNIWLCPNEQSSCAISPVKWEYGMTYSSINGIPKEILDTELVKVWKETNDSIIGESTCIIWKNWRLNESKVD